MALTIRFPTFLPSVKNYERRFKDADLFERIFIELLNQATNKKLVKPEHVFIDSTNVKASANKRKSVYAGDAYFCYESEEDGQLAVENAKNSIKKRAGEVYLWKEYQRNKLGTEN